MRQFVFTVVLSCFLALVQHQVFAQACGTRQLDPIVAGFLSTIQHKDLDIDQLRSMPIEQIKVNHEWVAG